MTLDELLKKAVVEAKAAAILKHKDMSSERAEKRAQERIPMAVKIVREQTLPSTLSTEKKVEAIKYYFETAGVSTKTSAQIAEEFIKEWRG